MTAIREFLQVVDAYSKFPHVATADKAHLLELREQIEATGDLRNLLLMLIRRYDHKLQSKQYLQDLVVTNHVCLLFLDGCENTSFSLTEHLNE